MVKIFEIYGGKAKVRALRIKTNRRGWMKGYSRLYPKKLKDGRIIKVRRRIKPYVRNLTGEIGRLIIIRDLCPLSLRQSVHSVCGSLKFKPSRGLYGK